METFPFERTANVTVNAKDYVARVRSAIRDKAELLQEVGSMLRFPYWVNPNWDGFNDWICDLSWLPQQRVLLLHEAAPHLPRKEMVIYLEMLLSGMDALKEQGRTLIVAFPEQTRALSDALTAIKR